MALDVPQYDPDMYDHRGSDGARCAQYDPNMDDPRGSDGAEDEQCRYPGNRHRRPSISISVLDPVILTYIPPGQQVSREPGA